MQQYLFFYLGYVLVTDCTDCQVPQPYFSLLGAIHKLYNAKKCHFMITPPPYITLYNTIAYPPTPKLYNTNYNH